MERRTGQKKIVFFRSQRARDKVKTQVRLRQNAMVINQSFLCNFMNI